MLLVVNLGREISLDLARFEQEIGPFPFDSLFQVAAESWRGDEWTRICKDADRFQPSISKLHEISLSQSKELKSFEVRSFRENLSMDCAIRGAIALALDDEPLLAQVLASGTSKSVHVDATKTRKHARRIEFEPISELSTDGPRLRRSGCCNSFIFVDADGNEFCPDCGQLLFLVNVGSFLCPNCGASEVDDGSHCVECTAYVGPLRWRPV